MPGEVLVIDTQNSTRTVRFLSIWRMSIPTQWIQVGGELFATESMRRGLQGLLIDGPCRDTAQIAEMNLPVCLKLAVGFETLEYAEAPTQQVYCTSIRPVSGTANTM